MSSLSSDTSNTNNTNTNTNKLSPDKVIMMGCLLIGIGMIGFYYLDGMIINNAGGSHIINSFYCSVMTLTTIGFGDICPGETDIAGRIFLTLLPILGLGFFCGPLLDLTSSWWQNSIPGGLISIGSLTLALGISMLTTLEGLSYGDATHLCVITGTTIGYGNISPSTDLGRLSLALYAILVVNVMGGYLDIMKQYLIEFCKIKQQQQQQASKTTTTTKKDEDESKEVKDKEDKTTTTTEEKEKEEEEEDKKEK